MNIIEEVKVILNKLKPTFSEDQINSLLNDNDSYFRKKVISNYYCTKMGFIRYRSSPSSRVAPLKEFNSKFKKCGNKDAFIAEGFLNRDIEIRMAEMEKVYEYKLQRLFEDFDEPNRNDTNKRLDYILTCFPSHFVPKLLLDGEYIREIDLRNSQLCILFNFLDQLKENKGNILSLKTVRPINKIYKRGKTGIYLFSDFWSLYTKGDVQNFKNYVYDGTIYDKLENLSELGKNPIDRNKAKELIFGLFFCKYNSKKLNESNLIKLHFPNVLELIKRLKQTFESLIADKIINPIKSRKAQEMEFIYNNNAYLYGNNYLSILLQRLESEIFIDHLLPVLYKEGYCCLPKHDSIMIKESHLDAVEVVMKRELTKFFGANFLLKSK